MTFHNQPQQTTDKIQIPHISHQTDSATIEAILSKSISLLKSHQRTDGYWWYALEANESIGAEFIFLMHYLEQVDANIEQGIQNRLLDAQRDDGSWAIYHDGPGHLCTSVECYFALQITGISADDTCMQKAREFIIQNGGIENTRVFTKIHLAMFGIVPWDACPSMPAEFIFLPSWFKVNIYEFSSWARATIVPLLVFMSTRKTIPSPRGITLSELFATSHKHRDYSFKTSKGFFSIENFFIQFDKLLKLYEKHPIGFLRKKAIKKCLKWTWNHVAKTEDIYPALAYGALAYGAQNYPKNSIEIQKPLDALKMFQQSYNAIDVESQPHEVRDNGITVPSALRQLGIDPVTCNVAIDKNTRIHQQCCISPIWDTPWTMIALLECGVPSNDPDLLKAGQWLLKKQITEAKGDWAIKNSNATPGGWAFEFENDYFPDVDDTIEILHVLKRLALPTNEKDHACKLGINWILSMQNDDGGWGAFDKNQTLSVVNRIPFSDHKACLDPSSPDITARAIELLASYGYDKHFPAITRAISYLWKTQESFGGWFARWGINYIYGAWCVLSAFNALKWDMHDPRIERTLHWLSNIQNNDQGWSESPESYNQKKFIPYNCSTASQTSWAILGLIAGGRAYSFEAKHGIEYLLSTMNEHGTWDEMHHTGTGFPGHFYIRYHGYRHFFPMIAIGKYYQAIGHITI